MVHVLFIDDEPDLLNLGKSFLEAAGFIVTTALGVSEALILLENATFDAIVSDYFMPEMDGIELLTILKSKGDTTPFIIYTGRGREEVVIDALNKGADFYIQKSGKPRVEFTDLASKIRYAVSRRKSERALKRILAYLKRSQKVAHIGSWTYNIDTKKFTGSDEIHRIHGYAPGQQVSLEEVAARIHPDDLELAKKMFNRLLASGEPFNIDMRIFKADSGELRYIQSQAQRIIGDYEGRNLVFGTDLDITERKAIEERVRETNLYLENLISIASVPILIWDPEFHITRMNRTGENLIGRSAEEVIGRNLRLLFPSAKADESMALIEEVSTRQCREAVEVDILHADGSVRTVQWNLATLYERDGLHPVATIAQGQDIITGRLRLIQERDAAGNQIQQNLAQLAILNDGIRNPLMVISGYVELSGDPDLTARIREQVGEIDKMVTQIDRRWAESEKILNFLRKHYEYSDTRSGRDPDSCSGE